MHAWRFPPFFPFFSFFFFFFVFLFFLPPFVFPSLYKQDHRHGRSQARFTRPTCTHPSSAPRCLPLTPAVPQITSLSLGYARPVNSLSSANPDPPLNPHTHSSQGADAACLMMCVCVCVPHTHSSQGADAACVMMCVCVCVCERACSCVGACVC